MSAGITIWCDHESDWGLCPQEITLLTTDLQTARAGAERKGWQMKASGDLCAHYHAPRRITPTTSPRRLR